MEKRQAFFCKQLLRSWVSPQHFPNDGGGLHFERLSCLPMVMVEFGATAGASAIGISLPRAGLHSARSGRPSALFHRLASAITFLAEFGGSTVNHFSASAFVAKPR